MTQAEDTASGSGKRSVFQTSVPPSLAVLREVRALASQPSVRVDDLAELICSDPVIVIEVLRTANSIEYSAGRPPATTAKQAIERLGAGVLTQVLDKIKETPRLHSDESERWLEAGRTRCRHAGRMARYLAEVVTKTLIEDCEVAGLLVHYGELLALVSLGDTYIKLAREHPRVKLLFRLEKDHRFDTQKTGINYLRRFGVPEAVMFGIDPEAQSKTPGRGAMKTVCQAASELALAFEMDKWGKYAPGQQLPPKSPVRMLGLSDAQFGAIYDKATQFLRGGAQGTTSQSNPG